MSIDATRFRALLLDERGRVERALATLRDGHPGSLGEELEETAPTNDNHPTETASGTLDREIDYTLGEHSSHVLTEIDAALRRLDDGAYGTCASCGSEIAAARLEAYPWAALCIDCKRKSELP